MPAQAGPGLITVAINPRLEPIGDETVVINEGCLSVPDYTGNVIRAEEAFAALPDGTVLEPADLVDQAVRLGLVSGPDPAVREQLGITRVEGADTLIVEPEDGEVDKLIGALLGALSAEIDNNPETSP